MKTPAAKTAPAQATLWETEAPAPKQTETEKLEETTARHRRAQARLTRAQHAAAANWNHPATLAELEAAEAHAHRCKHALRNELNAQSERRWKRNETAPDMQRLMGEARQNWTQN